MSYSSNKGQRISEGGLAGQILIKASNTDYDTTWTNNSGIINSVFGRIGAVVAAYGDYNSAQVTQGATNLYFTNALTRAAITASSPLSFSSGVVSIAQANNSTDGYLSSTDWNTFNLKGNATVTNIAMTVPAFLAVTGTPITTGSGTFAITSASGLAANSVLATPDSTTGAVSVRSLVANDIPNISAAKITTGVLSPAVGGVPLGFFGDGSEGDLIISSGTTTLSRDRFFNNVVISGTAVLNTSGFKVFVAGTLDITNAQSGAIRQTFLNNGGNASGSTGGALASATNNLTVGGTAGTAAGTAGGTGVTGIGVQTVPAAIASQVTSLGGSNGQSGGGGTSSGSQNIRPQVLAQPNSFYRVDHQILRGASLFQGGLSGPGGTSGAGDGTNAGAGGGGGGAGGSVVCIFAKTIARDSTTAAGAISSNGGNGGNGAASTLGTTGGGGGGAGGGAGVVIIYYANLTGSTATNAIRVYGGNGGNGGNSVTAFRSAGQGGQGGSGGRILLFDVTVGTITETNGTQTLAAAPAVIAAGDQVGGSGTTGVQTQTDL